MSCTTEPLRKMIDPKSHNTAVFDLNAIVANFPATASTMLIDTRLTDEKEASARVFRIYTPVAAHYHATCDEYLLVLSGRANFFLGDAAPFEVSPGQLIFFKQGTIHGTPQILEEPFVVFAVDTPRRDPKDVIFVNAIDGTPETFIQSQVLY
jgi:mannose-6-phosphate isomerase-like protein (cupin superfamily)